MQGNKILYLSQEDVRRVLTPKAIIEKVEAVFRQAGEERLILGKNSFLSVTEDKSNSFIAMPVSMPEEGICGLKWINTYHQPAEGYPFSHDNVVLINDIVTGSLKAVVSATNITTMRTAGGHGVVAAKYLAKKQMEKLAVIGCGGQGRSGVDGFLTQFPSLKEIRLYDMFPKACEVVKERYKGSVDVTICDTPEAAAAGCEVILTCSSSRKVLIKKEWIKKGTTIIAINAFNDLDPEVVCLADKWILGFYEEDEHNILNNPQLTQNQLLDRNKVYGDMTEVVRGLKAGRCDDDEIILYTHMGMGAFDVACAHMAYELAKVQGAGTELFV